MTIPGWVMIFCFQAVISILVGAVIYRRLRLKGGERARKLSSVRSSSPAIDSSSNSEYEKLIVDPKIRTLVEHTSDGGSRTLPLFSPEAFEALSNIWSKCGLVLGYPCTFTWFGQPFLQLPEDVLRMQEVIFTLKPDIVVETGIGFGGSLAFYATLFEAMGNGMAIGMEVDLRPNVREELKTHRLAHRMKVFEGSSTDPHIVAAVKQLVPAGATVLVVLDSDHSGKHVAAELECYHDLVTLGSYIIATDGIISVLHDMSPESSQLLQDNATEAAKQFAATHPAFVLEPPPWKFNHSGLLKKSITYWPGGWLKRIL